MQGQVIGVATLQMTGGQSINFAIPSERISQLQSRLVAFTVGSGGCHGQKQTSESAVQFFRDGLSFLSKDDCEKALPYFEKAVESDGNYAEAWAQTGFCKEKLGRHSEAIEASKKAVNLRPSAESYFNIGLANYYLKQYREAVKTTGRRSAWIHTMPPTLTMHWDWFIAIGDGRTKRFKLTNKRFA